jgi:hypothetical protein
LGPDTFFYAKRIFMLITIASAGDDIDPETEKGERTMPHSL